MFWKHTAVVIACTLPFALGGCYDESDPGYEPAQPTRGTVELTVNISGTTDLDVDGVVVRFGPRMRKMDAQDVWIFNWEEGDFEAAISGVNANCSVANGATHDLSVAPQQTTSLTFDVVCQPLGPAQIEFMASAANNTHYWAPDDVFETGEVDLGCYNLGSGNECLQLALRFDGIEEVLSGRRVKSATLRMYPTSLPEDDDARYDIVRYGPSPQWTGSDLTSNTRPPRLERFPGIPAPQALGDFMEWDVTFMVKKWHRGEWERNGFQVYDVLATDPNPPTPPYDRSLTLESDDTYTDHSHCPHLLIEFE